MPTQLLPTIVILCVHLLLGASVNDAGQIMNDEDGDIIWVDEHCVDSIKENDMYEVDERQDQFGCWPDDGKKPYPGPPTNLTTDIVISNTSGSCAALLHVSWTAPVTGTSGLTGFSLTMISMQLLPRAPCVTLIQRRTGSMKGKNATYNTTFSYNCLMLPFDMEVTVLVDSLPRSEKNSISSQALLIHSQEGQDKCEGLHTPTSSAPSTTSPHDEELIPALPVTVIKPFSTIDLAIIIPLAFVGLALVLFLISYVAYWRRLPQAARECPIHDASSTICVCRRCELDRNPPFFAPDKEQLIPNHTTSFSRSGSSYSHSDSV